MKRLPSIALAAAAAIWLCTPILAQPRARVTAAWFSGTWSDRADCSDRVHFFRNGQFATTAGDLGRWHLEGNVVVLTNPRTNEARRMTVERLDQNRLRSGAVISYRCEGRSPPVAG